MTAQNSESAQHVYTFTFDLAMIPQQKPFCFLLTGNLEKHPNGPWGCGSRVGGVVTGQAPPLTSVYMLVCGTHVYVCAMACQGFTPAHIYNMSY